MNPVYKNNAINTTIKKIDENNKSKSKNDLKITNSANEKILNNKALSEQSKTNSSYKKIETSFDDLPFDLKDIIFRLLITLSDIKVFGTFSGVSKKWEAHIKDSYVNYFKTEKISKLNFKNETNYINFLNYIGNSLETLNLENLTDLLLSPIKNTFGYLYKTRSGLAFSDQLKQMTSKCLNIKKLVVDYDMIHCSMDLTNDIDFSLLKKLKTLEVTDKTKDHNGWTLQHLDVIKKISTKIQDLIIILPANGQLVEHRSVAEKNLLLASNTTYMIWPSRQKPGDYGYICKKEGKITKPDFIPNRKNSLHSVLEKLK